MSWMELCVAMTKSFQNTLSITWMKIDSWSYIQTSYHQSFINVDIGNKHTIILHSTILHRAFRSCFTIFINEAIIPTKRRSAGLNMSLSKNGIYLWLSQLNVHENNIASMKSSASSTFVDNSVFDILWVIFPKKGIWISLSCKQAVRSGRKAFGF